MWRATQGQPVDEFFGLLKKGEFILHLPFWNSFPWEVNSFQELQNIKESEAVYSASESKSLFRALNIRYPVCVILLFLHYGAKCPFFAQNVPAFFLSVPDILAGLNFLMSSIVWLKYFNRK
jgi:hypothetical protein